MHYHWDGAQAQHVLEEEDDAAAAATAAASQAESGREVIWRLLFFWPRSHTTKFHLDDARYDMRCRARRGAAAAEVRWNLDRLGARTP